tara:strand:+ start:39291 stop:40856 length:1566 start_codon:yes stop_codon:yes gene_type:complete
MAETTRELFNKRYYDEKAGLYPMDGFDIPFPIDMWYGPKVLFGRVDQQNNVVYVSKETKKRRLKLIKSDAESSNYVPVLDFVAMAFSGFQENIRRAMAFGRLNRNSLIPNIKPVGGLVDPDILYETHVEGIFSIFSDVYLNRPERARQVLDFDGYFKMFLNFIEEYGSTMTLTRAPFLRSSSCTPLVSGLIIELAAEDFNDDSARDKWIRDPNFEFYVRTARKFGFRHDEHAPWRLIANLASPAMQKYWWHQRLIKPAKKIDPIENIEEILGTGCAPVQVVEKIKSIASLPHGATVEIDDVTGEIITTIVPDVAKPNFEKYLLPITVRGLFKTYFVRACIGDIDELKNNLILYYNKFAEEKPRVKVVDVKKCAYGFKMNKKRLQVMVREKIGSKEVDDKYDIKYWLKVYFRIRVLEDGTGHWSKSKFKRLLDGTYNVLKRLDKDSAIMYINEAVQGFPKRNSEIPSRQLLKYLGLSQEELAGVKLGSEEYKAAVEETLQQSREITGEGTSPGGMGTAGGGY